MQKYVTIVYKLENIIFLDRIVLNVNNFKCKNIYNIYKEINIYIIKQIYYFIL